MDWHNFQKMLNFWKLHLQKLVPIENGETYIKINWMSWFMKPWAFEWYAELAPTPPEKGSNSLVKMGKILKFSCTFFKFYVKILIFYINYQISESWFGIGLEFFLIFWFYPNFRQPPTEIGKSFSILIVTTLRNIISSRYICFQITSNHYHICSKGMPVDVDF